MRTAQHPPREAEDPLLALRGVGKSMWQDAGGADAYIRSMREEDEITGPAGTAEVDMADRIEQAWQRVEAHAGETFHTARGLEVKHEVVGNGIWFYREGNRIERMATRAQFAEAVRRCPLRRTTDIADLIDYPYLYALLTDARIRSKAW